MMPTDKYRKLLSFISGVSLLLNSFIAPVSVVAQEITETSISEVAPTTTPEVTPVETTPTPEPVVTDVTVTPTVTEEVTPTPEAISPTPTITEDAPTATGEPTPAVLSEETTVSPTDAVQQTDQPTKESQTTPPVEATPTVLPNPPPEESPALPAETLSAVVVDGVVDTSDPNFDFSVVVSSSATLTTDKPDYLPTDTVIIFGENYLKNTAYTLEITSDAGDYAFSTEITSSDEGIIEYSHQLDGTYRPNYTVTVKDVSEDVVASITFTDSPSVTNTANNVSCVAENTKSPKNLNCTANDVSIASVSGIIINDDGCKFPGDTVNFTADWKIIANATSRYNVGVWFATAGQSSALTGPANSCSVTSLPSSPAPFFDGGSNCGGINKPGTGTLNITITAICNPDTSGLLKLPYCTSWQENNHDSCVVPTDAVPGEGPKCNCQDGFTIQVPVPPSIEVVKSLSPTSDPGKFNLQINSTTYATNVGNGGVTGKQTALVGDNTFGETEGTATLLSNYGSTASCVLRGTTIPVDAILTDIGSWSLNASNGQDIVCTITNTRINNASITIVKDAQPDSSQDFTFATTGVGLSGFSLDDDIDPTLSNTKTFLNLTAGTYTITEGSVGSWYLSDLTCVDPTQNSTISDRTATINLAAGENVTCTYTNTMKGAIGGHKYNDVDGDIATIGDRVGVSGWTIELWQDDTKVAETITSGVDGTYGFNNLNPGNYKLKEVLQTGWFSLYPNPASDGFIYVTLLPGEQDFVNDFVNTQAASVTIYKNVDTDGDSDIDITNSTDWIWNIDGQGDYPTGSSVSRLTPKTYIVSEEHQNGYHVTTLICNNGPTGTPNNYGAVESQSIAISSGQNLVCTFTNTKDAGVLKIVKELTNDNGGILEEDDFSFKIDGGGSINFESDGTNEYVLPVGKYTIVEDPVNGYTTDYQNCTEIEVVYGQTATCTIINNDKQAYITVIKVVNQENGGNALPDDFKLTLTDSSVLTGIKAVLSGVKNPVNPGTYRAGETLLSGYTFTSFSGDCDINGDVTVALGESKTCTLTNDDVAPKLTLKKDPTNDNGGNAQPNDFKLTIGGNAATSGVAYALYANTPYTIDETQVGGYTFVSITGDAKCPRVLGGTVTLDEGDNVTCTIKNDDTAPTLTLVKEVTNDEGGNNLASEWILTASGTDGFSETGIQGTTGNTATVGPKTVKANVTYSLSESGPLGYIAGDWTCVGGTQSGSTITLLEGQSAVCTIHNCDEAPSITLIKKVTNNDGGTAGENDFGLTIGSTSVTSGQKLYVNANTPYALDEVGLDGYSFVSLTGDAKCPRALEGTVTLGEGEDVTCTILNDDIAPTLNLIKVVDSGSALPADWQLTANGTRGFTDAGNSVTFHVVTANEGYTLSESGPGGYSQLGDWQCRGGSLNGNVLTLDLAENVSCTVTNTRDTGTITIIKNAVGGNDTFGFTIGGETGSTQTINTAKGNSTGQITVATGFYTVSESSIPAGWNLTSASCVDDTKTEVTTSFSVDKGENIVCTFTNTKYGSIQGRKYEDLNGSGNWNSGEPYLNDWVIHLFDSGWTQIAQMETGDTGETGQYKFANLMPGTYYLCEDMKAGWTQTEPASGEVRNSTYCRTEVVNAGDVLTVKHFGNFKNTYIQGRKFNDQNANGLQDLNEPNINGWTIRLYDVNWSQIGVDQLTHNIPAEGRYRFENLYKGTYFVCEVSDSKWSQTYPGISDGVANLSGRTDEAPYCHQVVISRSNTPVTGKIFGNVELSDIHGYKWEDLDEDGFPDFDEQLLGGWTINLYKWNGRDYDPSPVKTMVTDSGSHLGWYWFENLLPGQYKICEEGQSGWRQTYPLNQDGNCHVINLPTNILCEYLSVNAIATCDEYNFGNIEEEPSLVLSKSNNSGGSSSAGATVAYTITVTNNGNVPVYNVTVYDVLPGGFTYVTGTTKINGLSASDPSISGGKLSWNVGTLGTLDDTEEVVVEYQAKLDSELKEGIYTNVAVCTGNTRSEKYVECNTDTSNVGIGQSVDISASIKGQVLGMTLPATGSDTWMLYLLLSTLFAGIALRGISYTLKKKD